jgi:hypothetical protein
MVDMDQFAQQYVRLEYDEVRVNRVCGCEQTAQL